MSEKMISETRARRVREALLLIENLINEESKDSDVDFVDLPDDIRWRFLVLGSSISDYVFWVKRADKDGGQWYELTEVETGLTIGAVTARQTFEHYFRSDW